MTWCSQALYILSIQDSMHVNRQFVNILRFSEQLTRTLQLGCLAKRLSRHAQTVRGDRTAGGAKRKEAIVMKTIALAEHFWTPATREALSGLDPGLCVMRVAIGSTNRQLM